jgi:hypothetical protein
MDRQVDGTERYLKEFQPRAIRALAMAPRPGNILLSRVAAVAALLLTVSGLLWFTHPVVSLLPTIPPPAVTIMPAARYASTAALTSLALSDATKFETVLTEWSRESLPDFQGECSTLKVLAKE